MRTPSGSTGFEVAGGEWSHLGPAFDLCAASNPVDSYCRAVAILATSCGSIRWE